MANSMAQELTGGHSYLLLARLDRGTFVSETVKHLAKVGEVIHPGRTKNGYVVNVDSYKENRSPSSLSIRR